MELVELGVRAHDVAVIHNGTDAPMALGAARSLHPTMVVLGRLVPHKRVEHAIDVLARLRPTTPGLRLRVIGQGWWHDPIAEYAERSGVADDVDLTGFVDEETKHAELASAWIALAPSVKEGWGLCVVEAATHGVPTIAYTGAGGLSESIVHRRTGLLVDSLDDMTHEVARLLADERTDRDGSARGRLRPSVHLDGHGRLVGATAAACGARKGAGRDDRRPNPRVFCADSAAVGDQRLRGDDVLRPGLHRRSCRPGRSCRSP